VTALALHDVERDFGGVRSLAGVSIEIAAGEVVGLIGPNGSGKTTLVNVAAGAIAPTRGRVSIDGVDFTGRAAHRFAAAGVVRTFQGLKLFEGMTVFDNVLVGAQRTVRPALSSSLVRSRRFRRRERDARDRARRALADVAMEPLADRAVGALSHGQRRRVEIARALAAVPRYLILDEPGAGVAAEHLDELASAVERLRIAGAGVLLVEHDIGLVERVSERVLGMVDGRVVAQGSFASVAAHPEIAPLVADG
jgi:ABC-type branched-subunit amino acid transport system ATPase component